VPVHLLNPPGFWEDHGKKAIRAWLKIKIYYERLSGVQIRMNLGTQGASHQSCLNITKYAACNSSRLSKGRGATATKHENYLLRVRSVLGRMKLKLPSRIETHVSNARPLIGIATSHSFLKERTFFLERLQQSLG
jgi:hypothetical protein